MGSFPRSSSLDIHTRTMVATKVLISLCVVGLASAAPQLGVPVQRSGASEQVIVTNVVSALQPSIAAAVADALRSISLTSTSSNTGFSAGSNNGFSAGSSSGFSAGSNSGFSSSRGSGFSSNSAAVKEVATVKEAPTARPNYAYEFKVADDDELTYITHNEARDGDDVTGVYSYVDPTGALVTVNYQAGAMGYSQTLEKQDGAVDVHQEGHHQEGRCQADLCPHWSYRSHLRILQLQNQDFFISLQQRIIQLFRVQQLLQQH